ncbi:YqgE/AlgH family protein [Pseudonocardia sp. NPDC046786]|uniref:YqgE/AlgH family protein n=1 Tax=Pseudonocardia sp. NPDC046786 TaxID=3155471 RepID=UPI0033DB34FC
MREHRATRGAALPPVTPGSLLVAAPGLGDPNFARTVVYMIEHRPHGSLGVVLNRPGRSAVRDVLPRWAGVTSDPGSMFVGGPVEAQTALCLAALRTGQSTRGLTGLMPVRPPVQLVDLDSDPAPLAPRLRGLRIFAGYSGWDGGQLHGEIARGDWFVVPGLPDDLLTTSHDRLWERVLRRQGIPLALLATFPADPAQN